MLYSLFLYESNSGILQYDKSFQDISAGKMEMFSAFFSALKSFISEMVLSGSKELKNIELGDYFVNITLIPETKSDLVVIADKEDSKIINKLMPKIVNIIVSHKDLFSNWNQQSSHFNVLDKPLTDLILSKKKLIEGNSLVEQQENVLKSIWSHKKEIPEERKAELLQTREKYINLFNKTQKLGDRLKYTQKLIEISEQLKNDKDFIKYQHGSISIKHEINELKFKLEYYLKETKMSLNKTLNSLGAKSLKYGDYKNTYLNLYSFSSKLKRFSDSVGSNKYQKLAETLIDKESVNDHKFSQVISEILAMKDEIEFYLN
jgi:hypothetical protein